MKAAAVVAFLAGLLLGVRVMFFGVQRRIDEERLLHRKWPLALAGFLLATGATLYALAADEQRVTLSSALMVVLSGVLAGALAWWFVRRSERVPSSDPDNDPRYRFQGHVARVTSAIGEANTGRISFSFDGRAHELGAQWTPEAAGAGAANFGVVGDDVVIERVEGDVAFVEPWKVVEQRL